MRTARIGIYNVCRWLSQYLAVDNESREQVRALLAGGRDAALGTLADGAPFVSLVLYAVSSDLTHFVVHLSKLALHTRNIFSDPRISLLIRENSSGEVDSQTLPRISIQGTALEIDPSTDEFENAKSVYLAKNSQAERNFQLGDFSLFKIEPLQARYVGGFGRILDLDQGDFRDLSQD